MLCPNLATAMVGGEGVSGVGDGGNWSSGADCRERLDGAPALIDEEGKSHRGPTVDAHVAVDEDLGVGILQCHVEGVEALGEPAW